MGVESAVTLARFFVGTCGYAIFRLGDAKPTDFLSENYEPTRGLLISLAALWRSLCVKKIVGYDALYA